MFLLQNRQNGQQGWLEGSRKPIKEVHCYTGMNSQMKGNRVKSEDERLRKRDERNLSEVQYIGVDLQR